MKRIVSGIMLTLLVLSTLTLAFKIQSFTVNAAVDPDASMVIVAPSSVMDGTGNTFTVNITLLNVVNMWGWSCVITWNPAIVNCTGKQVGPFNPSGTSLIGVIDNVNGNIPKLVGFTCGCGDTVTGSGIVCFLTFKTKTLGDVNLNVSTANYIDYPGEVKHNVPVTQQATIKVTWLGDLNGDFVVDEDDLWHFCGAFIDYYKIHVLDPKCDFNNDGKIDEDDLWTMAGAFIDYWKAH
jgi:hypothetical protein